MSTRKVRSAGCRGFSLVESLISILVLSMGLLGAAAMLVDSMRTHADALRRMAAVNLLRDMADRIRANPHGRQAYDTRSGLGRPASGQSASENTGCDGSAGCGPAARAAADRIHFFKAAVRVSPRVATVSYEPATGPAALERFVIALDVSRDPSEPDVLSTTVAQMPVAGGA